MRWESRLNRSSGTTVMPASGTDEVLKEGEIAQLVALAADVPKKIKEMRDAKGQPIPADVEFAFRDGRLALLQIRPFVESKNAQANQYLISLDASFRENANRKVDLGDLPVGGSR